MEGGAAVDPSRPITDYLDEPDYGGIRQSLLMAISTLKQNPDNEPNYTGKLVGGIHNTYFGLEKAEGLQRDRVYAECVECSDLSGYTVPGGVPFDQTFLQQRVKELHARAKTRKKELKRKKRDLVSSPLEASAAGAPQPSSVPEHLPAAGDPNDLSAERGSVIGSRDPAHPDVLTLADALKLDPAQLNLRTLADALKQPPSQPSNIAELEYVPSHLRATEDFESTHSHLQPTDSATPCDLRPGAEPPAIESASRLSSFAPVSPALTQAASVSSGSSTLPSLTSDASSARIGFRCPDGILSLAWAVPGEGLHRMICGVLEIKTKDKNDKVSTSSPFISQPAMTGEATAPPYRADPDKCVQGHAQGCLYLATANEMCGTRLGLIVYGTKFRRLVQLAEHVLVWETSEAGAPVLIPADETPPVPSSPVPTSTAAAADLSNPLAQSFVASFSQATASTVDNNSMSASGQSSAGDSNLTAGTAPRPSDSIALTEVIDDDQTPRRSNFIATLLAGSGAIPIAEMLNHHNLAATMPWDLELAGDSRLPRLSSQAKEAFIVWVKATLSSIHSSQALNDAFRPLPSLYHLGHDNETAQVFQGQGVNLIGASDIDRQAIVARWKDYGCLVTVDEKLPPRKKRRADDSQATSLPLQQFDDDDDGPEDGAPNRYRGDGGKDRKSGGGGPSTAEGGPWPLGDDGAGQSGEPPRESEEREQPNGYQQGSASDSLPKSKILDTTSFQETLSALAMRQEHESLLMLQAGCHLATTCADLSPHDPELVRQTDRWRHEVAIAAVTAGTTDSAYGQMLCDDVHVVDIWDEAYCTSSQEGSEFSSDDTGEVDLPLEECIDILKALKTSVFCVTPKQMDKLLEWLQNGDMRGAAELA